METGINEVVRQMSPEDRKRPEVRLLKAILQTEEEKVEDAMVQASRMLTLYNLKAPEEIISSEMHKLYILLEECDIPI